METVGPLVVQKHGMHQYKAVLALWKGYLY
jgi:hypothetical protein